MKKFFLLISALIVAAACSAPTNREATPATNANAVSGPTPAAMTEADAIAHEKAIWDAIKNKDYAAFGNMLADDQLEVTSETVFDKAGTIASAKEFEPSEVVFSDWKFKSIDKDAFLLTYTANTKGKYKGKEFPPAAARASSAWVRRGDKWLATFHQECTVRPAPAATASPVKSPASAAASPAAAPATATTGPDPIANEKIVWDFFKTRNYDGFAAVLAPDFFEVEPDGVYDKAESVKLIAGFDASKAELSDWKTITFDDDAALVTYVFKLPGMPGNGERHTSIWVKRDGKWLALFHHGGTQVMPPAVMAAPKEKEAVSPATKAPAKNP